MAMDYKDPVGPRNGSIRVSLRPEEGRDLRYLLVARCCFTPPWVGEMNANMLTDTRRTVACDGLSEGAARLAPLSQWSIEDRGVGAGRSMTGLA
jgi:hypothetical protein